MTDDLTFTDESVQLCPFPVYDRLREEQPVFHDPVTGHYVLTRYDDIRKILLNHKTFSNRTGLLGDSWGPEANKLFAEHGWLPMDTLVSNDLPEHRRFRKLVDKVFTTSKVSGLEPRISEIIATLIDAFPDEGEIDFLEAFAVPLPMYVIAEQLGVAREDRHRFKLWSDTMMESMDPTLTTARKLELAEIVIDMQLYMARQIERVRSEPDGMLLSQLANIEADGRLLEIRELQSLLMQILVAGNETTTTTLASCMKLLIEEHGLAEKLYAAPELAPKLAEETLRTATPLQGQFRRAIHDVTIGGIDIPADAIVEFRLGAGNRDPEAFECPATIDLDRKNLTNHLAFGAGIHTCVGNQLARGELRLALEALTSRLTNFRYSRGSDSVVPMKGYVPYGLRTLWMNYDAR